MLTSGYSTPHSRSGTSQNLVERSGAVSGRYRKTTEWSAELEVAEQERSGEQGLQK